MVPLQEGGERFRVGQLAVQGVERAHAADALTPGLQCGFLAGPHQQEGQFAQAVGHGQQPLGLVRASDAMDKRIQHLHLAPQYLQINAQFLGPQGHPGDVFAVGQVEVQGALMRRIQAGLASWAAHETHVGGRDMQLACQQGAQAGTCGAVAALQVLEAETLGACVFGRGDPVVGFGRAGRIKVDAPAIDDRKVRVRHGGIRKGSGLISRVYCRVPGRLPAGESVFPLIWRRP